MISDVGFGIWDFLLRNDQSAIRDPKSQIELCQEEELQEKEKFCPTRFTTALW